MKKVIANLLLIPFLPVVLVAFLWTVTKEAWNAGESIAEFVAEWLNN